MQAFSLWDLSANVEAALMFLGPVSDIRLTSSPGWGFQILMRSWKERAASFWNAKAHDLRSPLNFGFQVFLAPNCVLSFVFPQYCELANKLEGLVSHLEVETCLSTCSCEGWPVRACSLRIFSTTVSSWRRQKRISESWLSVQLQHSEFSISFRANEHLMVPTISK